MSSLVVDSFDDIQDLKNTPSEFGNLYLVPCRLGDDVVLEVLPFSIKKIIESCDHYIVENEKVARRFIKKIAATKVQDTLEIFEVNKYTQDVELPSFLEPCLAGKDMAIISDAGCPCIADPGSKVVRIAHDKDIRVIPLVGPSSILLALMASGMDGQRFTFHGYLPIDKQERKTKLKQLERQSLQENQTQIFIETPYRNEGMLEEAFKVLAPDTRLCVAADISLDTEFILTKRIKEWKKYKLPDLHKRPAIFLIQG